MNLFTYLDESWRIQRIEQVHMKGERRRLAGCNARLGVHGKEVSFPLVRITIGGISGFGWSRITREQAASLIGTPVREIFSEEQWIQDRFLHLQFPLFDWLGKVRNQPVYELLTGKRLHLRWRCPVTIRPYILTICI